MTNQLVSTVWPVNSHGEIVAKIGSGSNKIVGFLPSNGIPVCPDTGRVSIILDVANEEGFSDNGRDVIFDTDFFTDVDDAGALRVLNWAAKNDAVNLLGVIPSVTNPNIAQAIDALISFDSLPYNVPIASGPKTPHSVPGNSEYHSVLMGFSRNLYTNAGLPNAVELYRQLLAKSTNGVEILCTGFMVNLKELLESPADHISHLTGKQLVEAKVKKLWVMGGRWPNGFEYNFTETNQSKVAASYMCGNWPTEIAFCGFETSNNLPVGSNLAVSPGTNDPLGAAYNVAANGGRPAWDIAAAYAMLADGQKEFGFEEVKGLAKVQANDGYNSFTENPYGKHKYLVRKSSYRGMQQALDMLLDPSKWPKSLPLPVEIVSEAPLKKSVADSGKLLCWYNADDISVPNGSGVAVWPDRQGRAPLFQKTSGRQPTFVSNKNGKTAVLGASGKCLNSGKLLAMPNEMTVYVRGEFDVAPAGAQTLWASSLDSNYGRTGQLSIVNGRVLATNFLGSDVSAPSGSADIPLNTWATFIYRRDSKSVKADFNKSGKEAVANIEGSNRMVAPVILFASKSDGTESMTGWIHEVRIYDGAHSDAQQLAVIAEMN